MSASAGKGQFLPSLLRSTYPEHTVKRVAAAADVPHETARNYVRGRSEPSLSVLLRMAARCDLIAEALQGILNDRRAPSLADRAVPMAGQGAASDRGDKA